MLRLADDEPRAGASLDDVRFDSRAYLAESTPPTGLRDIVQASVIPRLCLALNPVSSRADRAGLLYSPREVARLRGFETTRGVLSARDCPDPAAFPSSLDLLSSQVQSNLPDHVDALVDALFANDVDGACARLDAICARGNTLERVFLDLLMPAAVQLNRLLAEDLQDCAAVTIAFLNLHAVLRRFAVDFREEGGCADNGARALLASPLAPSGSVGLQTFGLLFMAEFFRRDGWDALTERSLASASFRETIEHEWFDIVEVLASRDEDLDEIASGIRLIRRGARNRDVGIIACGRIFSERPEIIGLVGADRSASDLPTGLSSARAFVSRLSERQLLS